MNSQPFHPLVSIVIPVYNGANYMREAIDSALAQTYGNLEIVVVNDGSKDNGETDAIAKSYGDKIRYFSKENGGCASALNEGIANMRGEYFSWLSHDDKYLPNKVQHQIDILKGLADKNTIVYGGYEGINMASKPYFTVRPEEKFPVEKLNISLFPLLRGMVHGCALLIPKKYFDEVGVFDLTLRSTQDYALWFDMFRRAPLHFDPAILIQSRVHPDQGTHQISNHIEECNDLWCGFLNRLTDAEMTEMEGSPYNFLIATAKFLADNTPYNVAQKLALTMAEERKKQMRISVVIPFYNRVDWAVEAVQSVLAQTYPRIEIVLVDDGSTDDLGTLQALMSAEPRIRYFRQENAGPAKARNNGVQQATGDYIAFLDADDLFLPEKLNTQLEFMLARNLVISHTSYERIDAQGKVVGRMESGKLAGDILSDIMTSCPIAMPTVMARADILKAHPFPEHFQIGEDVALWLTLASKYEFGGINTLLSKVRVGQETAALNSRKQALGYINIAYFILHDPYLSQFEQQTKALLQTAAKVLSNSTGPVRHIAARRKASGKVARIVSLGKKVWYSLRYVGVRMTLQLIRRRLGL